MAVRCERLESAIVTAVSSAADLPAAGRTYTVAVRTLCEFTAKQGDLDLRFTPSPTAQEGIAGHKLVQSRRPPGYRSEISLAGEYGWPGERSSDEVKGLDSVGSGPADAEAGSAAANSNDGARLRVRGRADGYDVALNQLEEIKTHRGSPELIPENHSQLHLAQLKIYGWLMCQQESLEEIGLALIYFDIVSQTETVVASRHSATELRQFFVRQCACFLDWARTELAHRERRDAALQALAFPHAAFRTGQRELAEAVYRAASSGRCLMAQAPTGIGKTIATVFPLLKAMPAKGLDKIFFLAAKTSGRKLALGALSLLHTAAQDSMPANLRVLELVAREKACEYPERACHGDSCPLARGFYDKLPVARTAALAIGWLDRPALRAVALAHEVCPYYLSQDLARWSDVVIGDYNYYFDLNAMLYGLTLQNQWRVGVLVDEAHNLVERGRKMVGASLQHADFRRQRATAPAALKKDFDRLGRRWSELRKTAQGQDVRYEVLAGVPEKFLFALQQLGTAIMDLMNERPLQADQDLLGFYFDLLHFTRVAELVGSSVDADSHTLVDLSRSGDDGTAARPARAGALPAAGLASATTLCLRNIVPAYLLAPRWKAAHCAALFSATLSPPQFYRDMLGLPEDTVSIEVDSPFQAEQLTVRVAGAISTRYQHRDASALPIVELMAQQFAERPGNYLAFFSSFDYLHSVAAALRQQHPQIAVWEQARRMDEAAREQFLDAFVPSGQGIGFAVLGGVFGEGVDLPGDRLIGAFIATLGLPQWNPVNEQMRLRMQALYGTGYDYVYLYPGLQKVVQAAGRVIRTQQDRGVVYLIDDRFAQPQVRALLPEWWHVEHFTQRGKRQQVLET